jgi:hypothetical protein
MIKSMLKAVNAKAADGHLTLNQRLLERETGFLNHLAMAFAVMVPMLKAFVLMMNSLKTDCDSSDKNLRTFRQAITGWFCSIAELAEFP